MSPDLFGQTISEENRSKRAGHWHPSDPSDRSVTQENRVTSPSDIVTTNGYVKNDTNDAISPYLIGTIRAIEDVCSDANCVTGVTTSKERPVRVGDFWSLCRLIWASEFEAGLVQWGWEHEGAKEPLLAIVKSGRFRDDDWVKRCLAAVIRRRQRLSEDWVIQSQSEYPDDWAIYRPYVDGTAPPAMDNPPPIKHVLDDADLAAIRYFREGP